jgi:Flp pilus assembly pilin Flp
MQTRLSAFWNEQNGQDMVEYSLLIGFMALTGAAVLTGVRNEMMAIWQSIGSGFSTAATSPASLN